MQTFDFEIGRSVHCQDGECGKLTKVVVDPNTLQINAIIVTEELLQTKVHVIPVSLVTNAVEGKIQLSIQKAELIDYPENGEETHAVRPHHSDGFKSSIDARKTSSKNGQGKSHPILHKGKAISHNLALRAMVASALSEDQRTKDAVIEVASEQGIITLLGHVGNSYARDAAAIIAAQQPGVISVINSLKLRSNRDITNPHDLIEPALGSYLIERS